jgi:hypothetical protein
VQSNNFSYSREISESVLIFMGLMTSSLLAPEQMLSFLVYMTLDLISLQLSLA